METISENGENQPGVPPAPTENSAAPEHLSSPPSTPLAQEPVNSVAEVISPAELIAPRGRGRPKGSTVANGAKKPRRGADGKFAPAGATIENLHLGTTSEPQFISDIPGENPPGGPQTPQDGSQPGASQTVPPAGSSAPAVDYKGTALFIVTMATNSLCGLIGPEWEPENEQEKVFLVNSVAAYLETKQTPDIPPGMMLLIAVGGYSARRLNKPATQTFLQRMKVKIAPWVVRIKGLFSRRKVAVPFPAETQPAN